MFFNSFTVDKEKALRLLKQYRERLTGIGDVHYLEEVAFLIQTFESPVFEKLLRNMGAATIIKAQVKPEQGHHGEAKNGKVANSVSIQNGLSHSNTEKGVLLSSNNSNMSNSIGINGPMGPLQLSERIPVRTHPVSNGVLAGTISSKEGSGHTVVPSYNFYLTSTSNSQLSNTDSWGSIELPMGDEKRLPDVEDYHLQSSGGTASGSLKKFSVSNSPAVLSPLSQVPSSNKSSSSSMSVKSVVTVNDSIKGPPSDFAHSSSQEVPKVVVKKKEQHITVSLHKGKDGLGFSVVGLATEHKGDLGIYIQDIQKGGLADK